MAAKPKPKTGSKRIVVALAVVALMVVGYLYYKSRSNSSAAVDNTVPASGNNASSIPASDNSGGGASGSGTGDTSGGDLLSALAGENQQLMSTFLQSENGLLSLAGSSVGAPNPTAQGVSEFTSTPPAPDASTQPAPQPATASQGPNLSQTTPLYQDASGNLVTVGTSGATQPAYADSTGGYVSPITYTGAGGSVPTTQTAAEAPDLSAFSATVQPVNNVNIPQSVSGETTLYTPPPLSAQGAAKTGTNPKKTKTLH